MDHTAAIEDLQSSELGTAALVKKLVAVYAAVDHVEKRGQNKFQNYSYVKASDVARAIRDALKQQNIFAVTNFHVLRNYLVPAKEGEMQAVDVECIVQFIDADTDAQLEVNGFGSGTDKGDKAIYKAQTGAIKYALRNAFLIPDESDPEADEEVDRQTSARPQSAQLGGEPRLHTSRPDSGPVKANIPPAPSSTAPPVAAPAPTTTSAPKPTADPNTIPNAEEYSAYASAAGGFVTELQKAGLTGNLTQARAKFKKYISKVGGVEDIKHLTIGRWDVFFSEFRKMMATLEGQKQAVELIEAAAKESK